MSRFFTIEPPSEKTNVLHMRKLGHLGSGHLGPPLQTVQSSSH